MMPCALPGLVQPLCESAAGAQVVIVWLVSTTKGAKHTKILFFANFLKDAPIGFRAFRVFRSYDHPHFRLRSLKAEAGFRTPKRLRRAHYLKNPADPVHPV